MADTKYVSSTFGDNQNGDGSKNRPWKTIQHGADQLAGAKGGTLIVLAGRYIEAVVMDGREYSNIIITGSDVPPPAKASDAPGTSIAHDECDKRPQVGGDAFAQVVSDIFTIKDADNVTLENLTILYGQCGVHAEKCKNLKLTKCCIHDNTSPRMGGGFFFKECTDCAVEECRVWSNTAEKWGGGGGRIVQCQTGITKVKNCSFYLNKTLKNDGGALFVGGGSQFEISNCEIGGEEDQALHKGPNEANGFLECPPFPPPVSWRVWRGHNCKGLQWNSARVPY